MGHGARPMLTTGQAVQQQSGRGEWTSEVSTQGRRWPVGSRGQSFERSEHRFWPRRADPSSGRTRARVKSKQGALHSPPSGHVALARALWAGPKGQLGGGPGEVTEAVRGPGDGQGTALSCSSQSPGHGDLGVGPTCPFPQPRSLTAALGVKNEEKPPF